MFLKDESPAESRGPERESRDRAAGLGARAGRYGISMTVAANAANRVAGGAGAGGPAKDPAARARLQVQARFRGHGTDNTYSGDRAGAPVSGNAGLFRDRGRFCAAGLKRCYGSMSPMEMKPTISVNAAARSLRMLAFRFDRLRESARSCQRSMRAQKVVAIQV